MRTPADLTVMIIDDNDYARAIAETSLKKLGIGQVIEVADAASGLARMAAQPVDVVLLDWYMPEINGAGFVRMARAGNFPAAIVVTTAYATKQNIGRMRELRLEHILIKPFEPVHLHRMIVAAIADVAQADVDAAQAFHL